MTRLVRRATLLVALYLLTSAATAHAECAWVLWRQTLRGSDEAWFPQEAHTNVSECRTTEAIKNRAEEAFRERTPPEQRLSLAFSYLCLPDTVDPRGPKGK